MPPAPTGPPQRATLRTLAGAAKVSVPAVSLALRNHPSIGPDTRTRIQELAKKFGYVPDPALIKLMHHLRWSDRPSRVRRRGADNAPTHAPPISVVCGGAIMRVSKSTDN